MDKRATVRGVVVDRQEAQVRVRRREVQLALFRRPPLQLDVRGLRSGPVWFPTADEIVDIHERLLAWGGEPGVRHPGAIQAAIERTRWGPFEHEGDIFERAALLMRGIAQDHPFVDGNKRTAFMAVYAFLEANGWVLEVDASDATEFLIRLAQGLDIGTVRTWIGDHTRKL